MKAINIYTLIDSELKRTHELLVLFIKTPSGTPPPAGTLTNVQAVYKRICDMQDVLIKHMGSTEEVFQQKVAELALTGESNET